ncbi:MAG: aromatic ring-hydroxylating dioxygenase subunit alpha [Rhodospirillaceae bacterium]|nr:aromatic ring-hydroxylating dioxygenase subunit alpha [Rhodospirillaceae bacterium]
MATTRKKKSEGTSGSAAPFLRNHWYVAAWSDEVGRKPLGRVVLGDYLVLYRAEDGRVIALENRCPHRNLPLSEGRLEGDRIECGYHGMVFDGTGACTHLPGEASVPGWARVKAYPVVERQGWVMVWMGDPERADPATAPAYHTRLGDPGWFHYKGHIEVKCGYRLILDNLLDLSHLAYVHSSTTGNRALAERATITAEEDGDTVRVARWMSDIPPAQAFIDYAGYEGSIDRWQFSEFIVPSYIYVNSGTTPAGQGVSAAERRDSQGLWGFVVYHALTPETERSTHQFWAVALEHRMVPDSKRAEFEQQMRNIPLEDVVVYEAQQRAIDLDPEAHGDVVPRGMIPADKGLFAMRRILTRLYAEERGTR